MNEIQEILINVIKIYFINFYTCIVALRFNNNKIGKNLKIIISTFLITLISEYLDVYLGVPYIGIWNILMMSVLVMNLTKENIGFSIILTTISFSVSYIIYSITVIFCFVINKIININDDLFNFIIIILIFNVLAVNFYNIKRIKNGVAFLQNKLKNEYLNMLILNISVEILFLIMIFRNYNILGTRTFVTLIFINIILMFITIQKSLQLYYKQKMLVKDLEETKVELEDKKKEVEELEKENLNFSKISHSIAHKQKSLEFKLNELSMKSEISSEIGLKDRIEKLGKELTKETISVIGKTGIEEIDDMLKYMQSECVKNKIDFQLQISGNIYTMINHYIDKEELEILLADHIKNAIIAIGYGDNINKSILVRLGKLDGYYGLYIYDSGIEFEIETLYKLGKIPATTHKDNGGTGMGFMNTFDTLRKHKASFVIEEYGKPVKNNFTKALKFIFNQKNEFKIYSYRNEEIEKENKENNLLVEKLNI